ncbi:glycosyltransferase [Leptolyngbya sp. DQ-M1]|uniref:glycosyltransferase n=1 Tax=Leptolyngbya sp. DQ-M1 TaxID=2933920 RepID=UPI00329690E1
MTETIQSKPLGQSATQQKSLQVLMMPDYRADNPYQSLLSQALEKSNLGVEFPVGYRRVFPIFRAIQSSSVRIDVLHLHWLSPYLKGETWLVKFLYCIKFLLDILLARLAGVRIVWTIHNTIAHDARFPRLERWTQQGLMKLVDRAIVHHAQIVPEIAQTYHICSTKLAAIAHGHYRGVYGEAIDKTEARHHLGLPIEGRIYLFLGMLRPYKGIERLLQAWQDYPVAQDTLLIAGKALDEGYGCSLIEKAAKLKNVIIHSKFIENNDIPTYFSAADIVVLPFERILTSGSLILAMSYDKPSVAPRLHSIAETLDTAGDLLYLPQHQEGLLQVLKNSTQVNLEDLSRRVKTACDRLDWDTIGQKTQQVYESALSSIK